MGCLKRNVIDVCADEANHVCAFELNILDDRVARKQVGGREQIEGKKSEVTEDE